MPWIGVSCLRVNHYRLAINSFFVSQYFQKRTKKFSRDSEKFENTTTSFFSFLLTEFLVDFLFSKNWFLAFIVMITYSSIIRLTRRSATKSSSSWRAFHTFVAFPLNDAHVYTDAGSALSSILKPSCKHSNFSICCSDWNEILTVSTIRIFLLRSAKLPTLFQKKKKIDN